MSAGPDADSWTFVQVDPTAPKKRRKRRKVSPTAADAAPGPGLSTSPGDDNQIVDQVYSSTPFTADPYEGPTHDAIVTRRPREAPPGALGGMDDFERFISLSDAQDAQSGEGMNWTDLFGENLFTPWTPMATTPVESALFDFYAMETVKASVSFDDEFNPFREALLPLAASDPSTFHAALAVAGAHWANRLRLSDRQGDERTLKQVRLLDLASAYHRSIAQDIVKQPFSDDMAPAARQAAEEARVGSKILNMTWQTFSDGFIVRGELLRDVHRVIRSSENGRGVVGAMGRFLRIWLSWVDTLDAAAHRRVRSTWDSALDVMEQEKVDHALQRTVGCTRDTLQLIARTSTLSAPITFLDFEAVKHHADLASDLHSEILQNLSHRVEPDEASTAARAFLLALHLYFLTAVHHSALDHPSVIWGIQHLLNLLAHAEEHRHRQGWATWPYFILGLHVTSTRHRRHVLDRFTWLATTLSVGNLSTLKTCLEMLWERRDKGDSVTWQEISISLGGAIVTPL